MKNKLMKIVMILVMTILLVPSTTYAKITATGLADAVKEEIEIFGNQEAYADRVEELKNINLDNYSANEDKVNVYVFRGNSCSHCFDAVSYFASIAEEYGEYFNFISFETWANQDNAALMEEVASELGEEASGVPYIIIGKKTWSGFADSMDSAIKETIKSEYEKDVKDRYDVVKVIDGDTNSSSNSSDVIALIIIILVTGAIVFGIIKTRKSAS